jgi:hypothetical protein
MALVKGFVGIMLKELAICTENRILQLRGGK